MRIIISLLLALTLATPASAASAASVGAASRQETIQVVEKTRVVHGNAKSRIYHNASCKYFHCKACTVKFPSAKEAESQGFRACKVCGG